MQRLFKNGLLDLPLWGVWGPRRLKMEALNALKQGWNTAKEVAGWTKHSAANMLGRAILLLPVIFILALVLVPLKTPPFTLLPEANQAGALLGNLLTAQAAVAALTLAVSLFLMQGISSKEEVNNRRYREYVRLSWLTRIFWNSLLALLVTAAVLLCETILSENPPTPTPGLRNMALIAIVAFAVNLALAGILFSRAIHLSYPLQWQTLRRDLNRRDVLDAIRAFLLRHRRMTTSLQTNNLDISSVYPDPREASADEAIRGVLDDARRAMAEGRRHEFEVSLAEIKDIIEYAMGQLIDRRYIWGLPGSQPVWPPLRELGRNLYSFKEEIIRQGGRQYLFDLLDLDRWLTSTGLEKKCGELFTIGLNGYRQNYNISNLVGVAEFQEIIRERIWSIPTGLTSSTGPEEQFPFLWEMVRLQEQLLSDAIHVDRPTDFASLDRGFSEFLSDVRRQRGDARRTTPESAGRFEALQREYRIAKLGLAGRAMVLAQSSRITDVTPYTVPAREIYSNLGILTEDLSQALRSDERMARSQWSEWEWEGVRAGRGRAMRMIPERYPLTFFSVRFMELVTEETPIPNLPGNARKIVEWFTTNSGRLLDSVQPETDLTVQSIDSNLQPGPDLTLERRRELSAELLTSAVGQDIAQEENEIIQSDLSKDRISKFVSDVYASAFSTNTVERIFEREGAFLYLTADSENVPEERGMNVLEAKGFLAETTGESRTSYAPLEGQEWGRHLSDDVPYLLCEALDNSQEFKALMETPREFLGAIDRAEDELSPAEGIIVVAAGDWFELEMELNRELPDGYKPDWQLPGDEQFGEIGRYRDHPILRGPRDGERRIYVVEPRTWGRLVRAQFENGQDLRVEVNPITFNRAQQLLDSDLPYFPDEPNAESKLRKLQARVEIIVGAQIGFCETDESRARRISAPSEQEAVGP